MPDDDQRLTTDDFSSSPSREGERDRSGDGDPARETTGEQERGRETTDHGDPPRETTGEQERGRETTGDGDRGSATTAAEREEPLLPPSDLEELRQRWDSVQAQFVDEPRQAVEEADELVAEVMRKLADTFSSERSSLEEQWERAGEADTETLRVTLQRYRSFFNRLLSA